MIKWLDSPSNKASTNCPSQPDQHGSCTLSPKLTQAPRTHKLTLAGKVAFSQLLPPTTTKLQFLSSHSLPLSYHPLLHRSHPLRLHRQLAMINPDTFDRMIAALPEQYLGEVLLHKLQVAYANLIGRLPMLKVRNRTRYRLHFPRIMQPNLQFVLDEMRSREPSCCVGYIYRQRQHAGSVAGSNEIAYRMERLVRLSWMS